MKIAFIGIGVMGRGMVHNLLKNGHEVHIYSRTKAKAKASTTEGAIWHDTIADCVRISDIIFTIVGYPKDVEEVYFGEMGILANAQKGSTLIDMTTSSPKLAQRIYIAAKERGLHALDAPVSGGDIGAANGTLTIMVGGDRSVFESYMPVLLAMGKNIRYQGESGSGQHTKMANQIAIAGAVCGVCEAIYYAQRVGLDKVTMLETISSGAAGSWQMSNNGVKILKDDFAPGFYIKHFVKDMALAKDEADDRSVSLPVLEKVLSLYRDLEEQGLGEEGTQALIKAYRGKNNA